MNWVFHLWTVPLLGHCSADNAFAGCEPPRALACPFASRVGQDRCGKGLFRPKRGSSIRCGILGAGPLPLQAARVERQWAVSYVLRQQAASLPHRTVEMSKARRQCSLPTAKAAAFGRKECKGDDGGDMDGARNRNAPRPFCYPAETAPGSVRQSKSERFAVKKIPLTGKALITVAANSFRDSNST
ncbi:hypothetical protein EV128_13244 [Rhizobium azibense]|nr:hypothetical protein EV128_13244 [Rhizobium azibense]